MKIAVAALGEKEDSKVCMLSALREKNIKAMIAKDISAAEAQKLH